MSLKDPQIGDVFEQRHPEVGTDSWISVMVVKVSAETVDLMIMGGTSKLWVLFNYERKHLKTNSPFPWRETVLEE